MGIAPDLMEGTRKSVLAMIEWIVAEHGLTRQDAYMLCSLAGDLKILEVVDDPIGDEITGGLHDDSDAPCSSILLTQAVDDLVGDPLAHGIEQAFAARQDDAPGFLRQRAIG